MNSLRRQLGPRTIHQTEAELDSHWWRQQTVVNLNPLTHNGGTLAAGNRLQVEAKHRGLITLRAGYCAACRSAPRLTRVPYDVLAWPDPHAATQGPERHWRLPDLTIAYTHLTASDITRPETWWKAQHLVAIRPITRPNVLIAPSAHLRAYRKFGGLDVSPSPCWQCGFHLIAPRVDYGQLALLNAPHQHPSQSP